MKFHNLFLSLILVSTGSFFCSSLARADLSQFEPLKGSHPRILIFAPHPDDDVLGASGVMKAVLALKEKGVDADLRVVYMTMGDSYGMALKKEKEKGRAKTFTDLGETRHKEALAALQSVGVGADKAIFLAYPDQSLMPLFSLPHHSPVAYTSPAILSSKVVYSFAAHPGTPFLRDSVSTDIQKIIKDFKPTAIFTPTLTDGHPDHRGTREFVNEALHQMKSKASHYEFLIHWELIEDGWPQESSQWQPPQSHVPADFKLDLSEAKWSGKEKQKTIALHESQTAVDGPYLLSFGKDSEVFWKSRATMGDYLKK